MPAPANLVHETSTTTGTGNLTLVNVNGKNNFNTAFGTGGTDTFDYFISNQAAAEWERGTGHLSDASTLVRDTVLESTNSDNAVDFSAGTKDVTNDVPAASQYYAGGPDVDVADGGTGASTAAGARTNLGLGGAILQVLQTTYAINTDLTTTIPRDDTTPTSSEGTQVLSQAITPSSSSHTILCTVSFFWSGTDKTLACALFRGTTCINVTSAYNQFGDGTSSVNLTFRDSPATTSSTTYSVRVGGHNGTIRLNGTVSTRLYGGTAAATLTLMEIAA